MKRLLAAGVCAALLAGCAGPQKPKPKPLDPIAAPMPARVVWNQRVDGSKFPLWAAVGGGTFTVAGGDGTVLGLQADSGKEAWRVSVGEKLAAGVGSDGTHVAVVTVDGVLVGIGSGRVLWRKPLGFRVLTAPLVAGERIFVLALNRNVYAFDAQTGASLWSLRRPGDPLTLAQGGVVAPFKNTLLAGQGSRLAALDPDNGNVRWEVAVATPRGTNEVERLADLVGPLQRVGDLVCARSFQAAVGCVNAERGMLAWSKTVTGGNGVAADAQLVFGSDGTDRISAWKTPSGDVAWSTDLLQYRALGAPAANAKAVVFGDAEGTVHFLSRDDGHALQRLTTDGSPITAAPVFSGSTMLVVTRDGGLFAIRPE